MITSTILTFLVGTVSIVANICIAIYNVGKNRKIYEIEPMVDGTKESVNEKLKSGDYTILYVGPGRSMEKTTYILGKLNQRGKKNDKRGEQ